MVTGWVPNLIGLVIAVLAATLLAPVFPDPASQLIAAICWIGAAVFAILLIIALWRRFAAGPGPGPGPGPRV